MKPTHRKNRPAALRRTLIAWGAAALLGASVLATGATLSAANASDFSGPVMGGRAIGVAIYDTKIVGLVVPNGGSPDTGFVSSRGTQTFAKQCGNIPGSVLSANLLCGSVSTDAEEYSSVATSTVAKVHLGLPGFPAVDVQAIGATSSSNCWDASTGSTTIAYLKIGTKVIIAKPTPIAPNTKVLVGALTLTLNEQVPSDAGLTVNAIHLKASVLGAVKANVVVASVTSGVSNCYVD